MTSGERRTLTPTLVAAGNKKAMSDDNDEMRIGCFERTGNLITMHPLDEFDKKLKLQGMTEGSFQVLRTDRSLLDGDDSANNDEADSTNGEETVERQVLEGEENSGSDATLVGE